MLELKEKFLREGFTSSISRILACKMLLPSEGSTTPTLQTFYIDGGHRVAALQKCIREDPEGQHPYAASFRNIDVALIRRPGTEEVSDEYFTPFEVLGLSIQANTLTHEVALVSLADRVCSVVQLLTTKDMLGEPNRKCIQVIMDSQLSISKLGYQAINKHVTAAKGFRTVNNKALEFWSSVPSMFTKEILAAEQERAVKEGRDINDDVFKQSVDMYGCNMDLVFMADFRRGSEYQQRFILLITALWTRMRDLRQLSRTTRGFGNPFVRVLIEVFKMSEPVAAHKMMEPPLDHFYSELKNTGSGKETVIANSIAETLLHFNTDDNSGTKHALVSDEMYEQLRFSTGVVDMEEDQRVIVHNEQPVSYTHLTLPTTSRV